MEDERHLLMGVDALRMVIREPRANRGVERRRHRGEPGGPSGEVGLADEHETLGGKRGLEVGSERKR